ncbi:hypothetical protein BDR26DRAFT_869951 [Obelidium mucronatum]|nr:hypothetical protein BDR26DRAFT_869951 [Obelidium mucronatum]
MTSSQLPLEVWANIITESCIQYIELIKRVLRKHNGLGATPPASIGSIPRLKQLRLINKAIFTYTWTPAFKCQIAFGINTAQKSHALPSHKAFMKALKLLAKTDRLGVGECIKFLLQTGILQYKPDQVPNVLYRFEDWFKDDIVSLLKLYGFKRPLDGILLSNTPECKREIHKILQTAFPNSYKMSGLHEPGWVRVVWRICEELDETGPSTHKHEGLRPHKYYPSVNECVQEGGKMTVVLNQSFRGVPNFEQLSQQQSARTCWKCGEDGLVRDHLDWIQTLCDGCLAEI